MREQYEELEEAYGFERLLADLSARFVRLRPEEVDSSILGALAELVEFLDVDRSTLVELSPAGLVPIQSYARAGTVPHTTPITRETLRWYHDLALRGDPIVLERLPDDLPEEATDVREFVNRIGMKSHVGLPLVVSGAVVDLLGIATFRAHRAWSRDLVTRLTLAGEVLANALHRKRADRALRAQSPRSAR
jgi:GAF domain-containing protein